MPQIPEFSVAQGRQAANSVELRPSEVGIEALSQGARNISRLTTERAQMERQQGQDWDKAFKETGQGLDNLGTAVTRAESLQEISSMGPAHAQLLGGLTDQLNKALQSGDPNAISQFKGQLEDQLDQFQSLATTPAAKAHAIDQANTLRTHFTMALTAEAAAVAGHKVVADIGTTSNLLANTVSKNPQALPAALTLADQQIDALVAQHTDLTPQAAAEMKTTLGAKIKSQIAGNAVLSVIHGNADAGIDPNPALGRKLVDQYSQYLPPEMQARFHQSADIQDKMDQTNSDRQLKQDQEAEAAAGREAIAGAVNKLFANGPGGVPDVAGAGKALQDAMKLPGNMNHPELGIQAYKTVNSIADAMAAGKRDVSDPGTLATLQTRALLPLDDPNHLTPQDLYKAKFDHKVSNADFAFLNEASQRVQKSDMAGQLDAKLVGQFTNQAAQALGGGSNPLNPTATGQADYTRFMAWFTPNLADAQRRGESTAQFIDKLNSQGDAFWQRFKTQPGQNAGSGLYVPGSGYAAPLPGGSAAAPGASASAPIPPANTSANPDGTSSPLLNLFHSMFPGGK